MSMKLDRPAEVWRRHRAWRARLVSCLLAVPLAFAALAGASAPRQEPGVDEITGVDDIPSVDEIIEKHIAARGGAARLADIQSLMLTGRIQFSPEIEAPITVRIRRPNQIRQDFILQTRTGVRAYDGAVGWQRMPGPGGGPTAIELLRDAELKNIQDEAESGIDGPLVNYRTRGHRVELAGKQLFEQKECFVIKVTLRSGHVIRQYLDASSYLAIGERITRSINGKDTEIESTIGDYRAIAGVQFAHLFVSGTAENPRENRVQFEKIIVNPPLDEEIFKVPFSPVAGR